jgi:hypothetical protein
MVSNTRKAVHRREKDIRDTESNTKNVVSRSRLISESAISRARKRNPFYTPSFFSRGNGSSRDTAEPDIDFIVEKNKIKNYIELV